MHIKQKQKENGDAYQIQVFIFYVWKVCEILMNVISTIYHMEAINCI